MKNLLIICLTQIYINKIKNRITFKIKPACYFEFLTLETARLFRTAREKITKGDSRVLHTIIPDNSFEEFINKLYFLTRFNSEF